MYIPPILLVLLTALIKDRVQSMDIGTRDDGELHTYVEGKIHIKDSILYKTFFLLF